MGKSISQGQYYKLKRQIESDDEVQQWLSNFSRVGFVLAHKKRIDEMELLQKIAFEMLSDEQSKPDSERDKSLELQIMDAAARFNKRLTALAAGSPVLAQMRAAIENPDRNRSLTAAQLAEQEQLAELMYEAKMQEQAAIAAREEQQQADEE